MSLQIVLNKLEAAQMLRQLAADVSVAEVGMGGAYQFKHTLTQEAAYRSLSRRLRQKLHRGVAECYEGLFTDRLDEHAALLAHHYTAAGDVDKALLYDIRAGDAALEMYAIAEALTHYERAIEFSTSVHIAPEQLLHLYWRRGRALELASRFAEAMTNYEEMERQANEQADARLELAALVAITKLRSYGNPLFDPALSRTLAARTLRLAQSLDDRRAEAEVYWMLMNQARFGGGSQAEAIAYGKQALALARTLDEPEQLAFIVNDLADVYVAAVGSVRETREMAAESQRLWRTLGNQAMLADCLTNTGVMHTVAGEFDAALEAFHEANAISQRIQNPWGLAYSTGMMGMAYWHSGCYEQAISCFEQGARQSDIAGFVFGRVFFRIQQAMLYIDLGAFSDALPLVSAASHLTTEQLPQFKSNIIAMFVYLALQCGKMDEAVSWRAQMTPANPNDGVFIFHMHNIFHIELALLTGEYERLLALSEPHLFMLRQAEAAPFVCDLLEARSRALVHLGRSDEARAALVEAAQLARQIGQRRSLGRILAVLADHSSDPAEGARLRAEAKEHVQFVVEHLSQAGLRTAFLALPQHRSLTVSGQGNHHMT